ncbi:hypothetical protein OTSUT76_1017 [Orientia tsutsugamushi str. UT76]|uniref:Transposase n=2 Tax=Orientia tsutsugamushi TaxID=784 RepID=A0A2U3RAF9_ORITS|nr:hypothetical protein OTSUT76_1017 [Orientia tsutsugamushi str. UT76]SPR10128.1 transposase [Orientia tsutsugamushi]
MPEIKLNLRPNLLRLFRYLSVIILNYQRKQARKILSLKMIKRIIGRFAGERVVNENVIGALKRFKIIANKYRS